MLKQHQYWLTKKTVQRKLGGKEDQCVISSDAELDAKIELFSSISTSCQHLYRIIDGYQERLLTLAQEENSLGRFLKDNGKQSQSSSKAMVTAGKAISYSGQQRMTIRPPLIRIYNELETFRSRAIADTQATISVMEKERTEYRAALSWMKSASAQLDPDSDKGLEKFRKAQNHVRMSKQKFDRLSVDCLEKIDLLAAARCNMFSHVLVAYQSSMLSYFTKALETLKVASKILDSGTQYSFSILKDLSQTDAPSVDEHTKNENSSQDLKEKAIDSDQFLFFQDDFTDDKKENETPTPPTTTLDKSQSQQDTTDAPLINVGGGNENVQEQDTPTFDSILNILDDNDNFLLNAKTNEMPSELLLEMDLDFLKPTAAAESDKSTGGGTMVDLLADAAPSSTSKPLVPFSSFFSIKPKQAAAASKDGTSKEPPALSKKSKATNDVSSWLSLFSELDPLANPETMSQQFGGNTNSHAT